MKPECASAVPPCPPMPRVPGKNTAAEIPPPSPVSIFGFAPVPPASYLQTPPESPSAPAAQLGLALTLSTAKQPPRYAQRPTPPAIGNKAICRRPSASPRKRPAPPQYCAPLLPVRGETY